MTLHPELGRVARFLVTGGGLFAVDFGLFLGLTHVDVPVWWAQTVSVSVRTVLGFAAHKWFTFRGDTADDVRTTARQGVAYLVQGAVNVPVSALVVTGCVALLGGWPLGGKVLSEAVLAVWVYALYRVFVYRLPRRADRGWRGSKRRVRSGAAGRPGDEVAGRARL